MRKAHPTDSTEGEGSSGEGEEGKSEEIEMEGPLVHVVAEDNETHEEDGTQWRKKMITFRILHQYVRFTPELCPFSLGTTWIFLSLETMYYHEDTLSFLCIPSTTH